MWSVGQRQGATHRYHRYHRYQTATFERTNSPLPSSPPPSPTLLHDHPLPLILWFYRLLPTRTLPLTRPLSLSTQTTICRFLSTEVETLVQPSAYIETKGVRILECERNLPGRGNQQCEIWDVSGESCRHQRAAATTAACLPPPPPPPPTPKPPTSQPPNPQHRQLSV